MNMPSANVKVEHVSSAAATSTGATSASESNTSLEATDSLSSLRQAITVIENKIRNLEKRKDVEESAAAATTATTTINANLLAVVTAALTALAPFAGTRMTLKIKDLRESTPPIEVEIINH